MQKKRTSGLTSSALIFLQIKLHSESVGVIVLPDSERTVKNNYVNSQPSTVVQHSHGRKKSKAPLVTRKLVPVC